MHRTRVASSVIAALGYDPAHRILEVEFDSGRIYQYAPVPPEVYKALVDAPSIGSYYNRKIRDRYPVTDVTPKA